MYWYENEVLTVAEAAEWLRVHRRTVWRWCRSGRLPAFKIGHGWRIYKSDLLARISSLQDTGS